MACAIRHFDVANLTPIEIRFTSITTYSTLLVVTHIVMAMFHQVVAHPLEESSINSLLYAVTATINHLQLTRISSLILLITSFIHCTDSGSEGLYRYCLYMLVVR